MEPVWKHPPESLLLGPDEVHVWRACLTGSDTLVARCEETLAGEERERAARFRFEKDRYQYVVARGVLRMLLGRYMGRPAGDICFRYTAKGKPEIDGPQTVETVHFNVSHSQGLALLAFTRGREIGVDLEAVRDDVERDKLAERFFSPTERAKLRTLAEDARRTAFFECWTRKEAYIKAHGVGLSLGLDQFDVSLGPDEPPALLRVEGAVQEAREWTLAALEPGPGYAGAVAVKGRDLAIRCWQWPESD